ncbi:tail fiber assembly protein [Escherichia coli]|uniref:tail fiber assembly protein n=1 Tax=Escherichia coli TaxID=562 RepID=UPI0025412C23|nr:tail fiber assembly protein [Escherichia coli]WIF92469.1 tail fiber assembly protein [Escherichia coli]WIF92517.1 tail fiber assembly protein [Escherichia coli]
MKEFAVVKAGLVVNIILWDGEDTDFAKDIDGELIATPVDIQVSIGWSYDGEKFSSPPEPDKTKEQLIQEANLEKEGRINSANEYMNSKQWPGKAAIGRLKGDELAQYNLWLDYLDALEAVDTSTAPEIDWPQQPE